jgi:acylphosphatase
MQETWKIIVHGKVQGVFYRQSTAEEANALGVNGTVRNLPNGAVEIYAQGTQDQLNALADWCRRGPTRAIVSGITTEKVEPAEQFQGFKVLRG